MAITLLPARLVVEPRIENWMDDSDPHYDFRAGYSIKHKDETGWHEIHYGQSAEVTAWLQKQGYEQCRCTFRRHQLAGRYEQKERM